MSLEPSSVSNDYPCLLGKRDFPKRMACRLKVHTSNVNALKEILMLLIDCQRERMMENGIRRRLTMLSLNNIIIICKTFEELKDHQW